MRAGPATPFLLAFLATPCVAHATSARFDAHMNVYLAIWSQNASIVPATVARLYGRRVDYYGHPMSAEAVYRDKLAFVQRWPVRRYSAVPGTVTNTCNESSTGCRVTALLRWSRADRVGHAERGINSVRLDLAREDGTLKIVRESGEPVSRR